MRDINEFGKKGCLNTLEQGVIMKKDLPNNLLRDKSFAILNKQANLLKRSSNQLLII